MEQDLHLDATLRLNHEHFSWALPAHRNWVRDFRRDKQFQCVRDGQELYVRYDEDGTRHTSEQPFPGMDMPLDHMLAIGRPAATVMAWLTAAHWLGDIVRDPGIQPIRDALHDLARGRVLDEDDRLMGNMRCGFQTMTRNRNPLPYHQLQLTLSRNGIAVWITLAGYDLYQVTIPVGTPYDTVRLGVVTDLRDSSFGFNVLPADGSWDEPRWALDWEQQLEREVAEAHPPA